MMTVCAVGAYYFSELVLGHQGPLFAATSAIIALGFSRDPRLRRVLEVGMGCTIGIAVGDLLLHWLGSGIWQAALVLFLSILLARFLDSGAIFTTQLALQSLLVVLLPIPAGGPFTRSLDAVVGGCFALAATFLLPRDPRREPKDDLKEVLGELSLVLRECASALSYNDSTTAWHALVRARSQQPRIDAMRQGLRGSVEIARLSPMYRRHLQEVEGMAKAHGPGGLRHALQPGPCPPAGQRHQQRGTLRGRHACIWPRSWARRADAVDELGAAVSDTTSRRQPEPCPRFPGRRRHPAAPQQAGDHTHGGRNPGAALPHPHGGPAGGRQDGSVRSPGAAAQAVAPRS